MSLYHPASRDWQDRFDTRRLADRIEEVQVSETVGDWQGELIASAEMVFLATADAEGRPQVSYKGGDSGFVRVVDERTIAFPSYDGNGMFLSIGNLTVNPEVGLLFVDFERQRRVRLNGTATVDVDDPLLETFPGAQLVVRVRVREIFPNCPRYVHRLVRVEASEFVPRDGCEPPVPDWKRRAWSRDVLPSDDPARATPPLDG